MQGTGSNAPFTTLGGLDYNWVQGRRATRFHVNDNLSWITGRHEFKFGISSRRLRINDFDFSTYTTPLVTYTTLPQFIYGVASTATQAFPLAASQPFNYLNVDFYAQDSIKLTANAQLDLRRAPVAQFQSGESARVWWRGFRDRSMRWRTTSTSRSMPYFRPGLTNLFAATPWALWQPRTALAWQFAPDYVLRAGFGVFSDILPGSVADLMGANPPYVNTFQGGLLGSAGGLAIAPGVPGQRHRRTRRGESGVPRRVSSRANYRAPPRRLIPRIACRRWR